MDEGQYLFYSAPFFFFFWKCTHGFPVVNHPATDTSLCLHPFTVSRNVSPRLFWRGLPDRPTNEEPGAFYGPAVSHIISPDNNPSLSAPPAKSIGFLAPLVCSFVRLSFASLLILYLFSTCTNKQPLVSIVLNMQPYKQ